MPYMLIIAVNFPNVFQPQLGLRNQEHHHYRYFQAEDTEDETHYYALVPYCLSALFAYRRAC